MLSIYDFYCIKKGRSGLGFSDYQHTPLSQPRAKMLKKIQME
jgi:hypothetical protein